MTAELVTTHSSQIANDIPAVMDYAKAVQSASMLPETYRGKPADIMLAVGLGGSMGLSPAESLYRINVIKGKPTASAELIASNVRKAGHRLRVHTSDDGNTVTATIVRADDPDFEHTVIRDAAWAKQMGLGDQANYKKQPTTMLQWRAISAVARLACSEALYGVQYTPDELTDDRPRATTAPTGNVTAFVEESEPLLDVRSDLARAMYAGIRDAGIAEGQRLAFVSEAVGRDVTSTKELTEYEARMVLDHLPAAAEGVAAPQDEEAQA